MASVSKEEGAWVVRWKNAAGRWQRKRTECATKAEAKAFARQLETHADLQRLGVEPVERPSELTFGELLAWYDQHHAHRVKSQNLRQSVGKHLAPELTALAEPFARAFAEAGPKERVFFSLQNPSARYDTDRTAGSMFIRDGVLHFILVDHYIFQQADPGGGERRDPRDTKGMKLWIVRPAQAASLLEGQEPRWSTFEKVHVSMRVRDVLAALQPSSVPAKPDIAAPASPPASPAPTSPVGASAPASRDGGLNVQQKVSDLDMANQKLRTQLEQQTSELDKLKNELRQLREELKASKGSVKSPTRKPAVKPSAE